MTLILDFCYLSCMLYLLSLIIASWKGWVHCTRSQSMRLIFFVMCKFVIHLSCVISITLPLLNVLVEVELKIISLSWFAASISLVHCNPLSEHCSLVDQGVLEGNAPSAIKWSTELGVEFWAQHPPHTQIWPVFNLLTDWYLAYMELKFLTSTAC